MTDLKKILKGQKKFNDNVLTSEQYLEKKTKDRKRRLQDEIKVMRLRNELEKKRLINTIQKLKLQKQVEGLRKKGLLPQPYIPKPIYIPQPYFRTEAINQDIYSMNADIGYADGNLFGDEDYHGGENCFDENFWGNEFDGDMLAKIGIKPKRGSPLLW